MNHMDENGISQESPLAVPSPTVPPDSISKSAFFITLVGLLAVSIVGFFSYTILLHTHQKMGQATQLKVSSKPSIQPILPSPTDEIAREQPSVSFAHINNKIILQYKSIYYDEDKDILETQPITLSNPNQYTWTELLKRPSLTTDTYDTDEVFSFKTVPNTANFIFVMRWEIGHQYSPFFGKVKSRYDVFYYDAQKKDLSNPLSFVTLDSTTETTVPKIDKISADGKFVSFNMHGCWQCEGGYPETLLLNVDTGDSKRIGQVYNFAWDQNGDYTYKAYKIIDCTQPQPGDCTEDPSTLPTLQGSFYKDAPPS